MAFYTICNMAAVRHLEFSKFRVYVTWTPCAATASLCKISLKSANRLPSKGSYGESATKSAVVAGYSQSDPDTLVNRPINAVSVVGLKLATSCDDRRRPSQVWRRSPVLDYQEPATVVAGSMHSGKLH